MTHRQIMVTLAAFIVSAGIVSQAGADAEPLQATLEKAWGRYLAASRSGNEPELKEAMSSFRFVTMKNDLARSGLSLTPERIKRIAALAPDISTCRFVTLVENGPTAALIYVRDSDVRDSTGKPRVDFYFMKFVKEDSVWRMDALLRVNSLKCGADGKLSQFESKYIRPTFEIDGQILKAPDPLPLKK